MRVVDDEAEGALGREIGAQPVEPVQNRERGIDASRGLLHALTAREVEQARGETRSALQPVGSLGGRGLGEHRLEQLPHDAEGEVALELGSARAQDAHLLSRGGSAGGRQHGRLADARRPLDDQKAASAGARPREGRLDPGELLAPLEQRDPRHCSELHLLPRVAGARVHVTNPGGSPRCEPVSAGRRLSIGSLSDPRQAPPEREPCTNKRTNLTTGTTGGPAGEAPRHSSS